MLPSRLQVLGKLPVEIEVLVAAALVKEELLVNPVVTVGILEYHSRPINVSGAVRNPLTFQAVGPTKLLDALGKAGGFSDNAGSEVLVTSAAASGENPNVQRIAIKELLNASRSELNLSLSGGEAISVPSAGRVFVLGNVKRPGAFPLREASEGTVLQMLALAEGLTMFSTKEAYIYRIGQNGSRTEVAVQLESILKRKASDVAVFPDDILYVPDNKNRRLGLAALERILMFGSTAGATALIYNGNR
jgi:polysaccharide export outer membrane protein